MEWNADLYEDKHGFVADYGKDLLSHVPDNPGQAILDLGCGTGLELDALFARFPDLRVTGIDMTEEMLCANPEALVLQIGCGLDSRCLRVKAPYLHWIDTDFPEVLSLRKKYYEEDEAYRMMALDASKPEQLETLPDGESAVLLLEGVSMYLTTEQVRRLLQALGKKYARLQILMDVYTALGARASKYKNPVKDVGVAEVYGIEEIRSLLKDTKIGCRAEHSLTPDFLVNALKPLERAFFRAVFAERLYRKFYRLYELERAA